METEDWGCQEAFTGENVNSCLVFKTHNQCGMLVLSCGQLKKDKKKQRMFSKTHLIRKK